MQEVESRMRVFVNRESIELGREEILAAALLKSARFEGGEWDLMRLDGVGDPSGGNLVAQDTVLELKDGEHFRVIPGNRTFG